MIAYIFRRLGYGLLVMLGVVITVFFLFFALPGDPVSMLSGQRTDVSTKEAIMKDLGLDKPLWVQLGMYLNDLSPLSIHEKTPANHAKYHYLELVAVGKQVIVLKSPYMRRSFHSNKRVDQIIFDHLDGTLVLALAAMVFATVVGILFGILAALKKNTVWDHSIISLSVVGISAPSFVAAILISMVFGYYLSDYTGLNLTGSLWVSDPIKGRYLELKNLILPAFTLGLRPLAIIVQLTRSSMLEVLSQDFIRTARAKGLTRTAIIVKHAMKNALNPVITAVSGWLAGLLAGAFFIEYIFNWKGIGLVTIKAVENLDFPVVMGTTIFIGFVFIIINLLVDILYSIIDPRVRLK